MHASTSSSLSAIALVASVLVSQTAQALPMTRSSSSVARRAHIASHQQHHNVARDSYLGDHAIVVDASSSGACAQGGIRNSTVNLTNISKRRRAAESTFSSFSRVVRSLFGGDRPQNEPLPLTFSPHARTAVTVAPHSAAATASPVAANPKRRRSTRQKRHRARAFGKHPRPQSQSKPQTAPALVIRNVKRDANQLQASIYSAAVVALPESTPTAAPVDPLAAANAIPTLESKLTSPYNGSALDAPNGSYGNAAAARAQSFSTVPSSVSIASMAASTSSLATATATTDETTAPTTPLVSVDANGITWVQATNVAVPTATGVVSSASSANTVLNLKNFVAAAASTATFSSSSSIARVAVSTGSSTATVVLPTSPPPSTMTGTSFARRA